MAQSPEERQFYLMMCAKEKWKVKELKRQINSALFERYMIADKPGRVTALIPKHKEEDIIRHFKDDYVLEFLNLGREYSEKELETAILDNLKDFFLEFGKSLAFVGSQYAVEIDCRENRIDLLFFHRELRCLVAVDIKIGRFKAEYIGQMQKYLAALDEKVRLPYETESIGLILCKSKGREEVKFALAKTTSSLKVSTYKTKLPDTQLILKRLGQLELGRGFTFVARQKRISINNEHYYADLVLYNRILKCLVIIDVKSGKFSHADAGQMNFYINYFRENETLEGENEPIGIVLCSEKDNTFVKYAFGGMSNRIFASKYQFSLPSPDDLKKVVEQAKKQISYKTK